MRTSALEPRGLVSIIATPAVAHLNVQFRTNDGVHGAECLYPGSEVSLNFNCSQTIGHYGAIHSLHGLRSLTTLQLHDWIYLAPAS